MNEIAPVEQHELALLDSLTQQAKVYASNAGMNMIMLGHTLTQAKPLIPHGDWKRYVTQDVGINIRWAQFCVACYERYGENEDYAKLGTSKMQIMLSLPPGTEDDFMQENDVEGMSTRELREAVKQAREEAMAEAKAEAEKQIEWERKARRAAEAQAEALAGMADEIPEETAEELRTKDREIERLGQQASEAVTAAADLRRTNAKLQRQLDEQEALLTAAAENYENAQKELRSAREALKHNEDERPKRDELTLDVFSSAVERFTGICGRLPYMRNSFMVMDNATRNSYDELLRTVEGWCAGSRKALNAIMTDGGIIIE